MVMFLAGHAEGFQVLVLARTFSAQCAFSIGFRDLPCRAHGTEELSPRPSTPKAPKPPSSPGRRPGKKLTTKS